MTEDKTLIERFNFMEKNLDEIKEALSNSKKKKFNLFTKGSLGKQKLKRGYLIILTINENGSVVFRKEPVVDGVIKLDDTFHPLDKDNILTYKNKPFLIQFKNKLQSYNPMKETNETYGQKYVMARMLNEALKPKKTFGAIGWWILILAGVGFGAYYLFGGGA